VAAPGGATDEGRGDEQRTEVLELLARTNAGEVADAHRDRADVLVTAGSEGTTVRVNGVDHSFEELVDTDRETGPEAYRQPVGVVA
jgi:hypothetical protein